MHKQEYKRFILPRISNVCSARQDKATGEWVVMHPFPKLFVHPKLSHARFIGEDAEQRAKAYAEQLNVDYRKRCGIAETA